MAGLPLGLVYGVDMLEDETWQELIQTGRSWVPVSNYQNLAPYAQVEFTGIDNLTLTTGVRYEESTLEVGDFTTLASAGSRFVEGGDPDFNETLFNIGGTYSITDNWRLFSNYTKAFAMPDVGRVLRGINVPNQSVDTFLDLKPILTENTEFGIEFDNDVVMAQLSYYTSDSDFGQRLQRGSDGIYTVRRERTEIDGLEFRTDWQLTDSDTLGLRYAETDGRYDSNGDNKVDADLDGANIAPDRINLSWDRQWSDRISSRLQLNHLQDREFDNANGVTVNEFDGYTTVDLSTRVAALGGEFNLAIQNLTNEDYFTYYSQTSPNDIRNFKGIGRSFSVAYNKAF